MTPPHSITLALTGASGIPYALRLLESLLASGCTVHLLVSQAAQTVAQQELSLGLPSSGQALQTWARERYAHLAGSVHAYGREEWFAPIASGSSVAEAMVVCPCSMGTLAAIAGGMSDNLIERAADVCIKEQRKLILVPRETPFSAIHLENMLKLSRLGVLILPANPGFYHHPESVQDLVDFVVARILDQLGITQELCPTWGHT